MPSFDVNAIIRLEVGANFSVSARNEEAANEKAEAIIAKLLLSWQASEIRGVEIQYEEMDQSAELDTIDEE